MPKFTFRLQRLLDYRRLQEKWAKDAFLAARARRLEAEEARNCIDAFRDELLSCGQSDLRSRIALESAVNRLDDEQRAQESVISILSDEESGAREAWVKSRQDGEALDKLREMALDEWKTDETRREQAELDEWSTTRRAG
jgi:flagellar export protein FliJ